MTYPEFAARWQPSGGAERANYGLFLTDLCDLLGVPRPDATTDNPAQDAYVLERAVTFDDGDGKRSTGRIDLYKRGCFVFETKQGVDSLVNVSGEISPSGGEFLRGANSFGGRIPSGGEFLRGANSFGGRIRWQPGRNVINWACPPKSAARATPSATPRNGGK